ncbi:MAG: glycine cleavage T C-terminal barrel domain-containing protein, partial [Pseudomonadota bacterium]
GLSVAAGDAMLAIGSHVVVGAIRQRSLGYVTSSYVSPTLERPIALALIEKGASRMGETVNVWHLGETREAVISSPVFFDPDGERLHA